MSKSVLNITEETKASDLVVLDKETLITISKLTDSIEGQVNCLKALMKASGIPYYSWDKENSVQVYAEQLKIIKKE
tara:strand:- start:352 stop:579 length:228 start_codon:yes stop_codon:yes gene_type:complete